MRDKAYLRSNYIRNPVDLPEFVDGSKGRYTLGKGKHGKVKSAFSQQWGRYVAIKSQPLGKLASAEERLARTLQLEHVIKIYDWAQGPNKGYIVMEQGVPMTATGATAESAREQIGGLIEAVRELHAAGVYHRDIGVYVKKMPVVMKNVLLVEGQVRLIDLAKWACQPPGCLKAIYERADARGVCRVMHAFLKECDPPEAKSFFWWYVNKPKLRLEDVAAYPWLKHQPGPAPRIRLGALCYPLHVFAEWTTSYAPWVTGRGLPKRSATINYLSATRKGA